MRIPAYLGLEKSCGRSRGPSGTLFRPLSAGLETAGGGREADADADMALEALALRSRLPLSVVLWNLRTRSSVAPRLALKCRLYTDAVPDEPLDSSPEMFDPDLAGRSIESMARVPVRTGAAMATTPTVPGQGQRYANGS
jgi:hypothetical protein